MLRCLTKSPLLPVVRGSGSRFSSPNSVRRWLANEGKQTVEQTDAQSSNGRDQNETVQEASKDIPSPPEDGSAGSNERVSEVESLLKQMQEKDQQLADLNDRALRALAEMENVRKIARRDVDIARKYAIAPFAKSLLSVADNLGLALDSIDKEKVISDTTDPLLKGLFVGVRATESELLKVFSQYGISRYGAIGDKFDPNKYQAMFEAPSADHEPGTVINVQKLGYEMGDRVLRPAEVGVSRAS